MKKLIIIIVLLSIIVFHWAYAQIKQQQDYSDCNIRLINASNCQKIVTNCLNHVANSSVANKNAYRQFFQDFNNVQLVTFCRVWSGVGLCKARYTTGCYYLQQGPKSLWPQAKAQLQQEIAGLKNASVAPYENSTHICSFKCNNIRAGQCQTPPPRNSWSCG